MHSLPQGRKASGAPVDAARPPPLITRVGPELVVWCLTGEPRQGADQERVGHGDDGPLRPATCRETRIQRRELRALGLHGCLGPRGQDRPERAMALAGFPGALCAGPVVVAWCHTSPRGQTWRHCKP